VEFLHPALPARCRRGRLLSRHYPLSDLLVSGGISRALPRRVCDRGAGLDRDRRADLGAIARARRRDGPQGLAVAIHRRGHPRRPARHRHLVLSDR
jgi:hypothetical protein